MIYGVCETCSHTYDLWWLPNKDVSRVEIHCYWCYALRWFRVVRQIEQPDGSVIEGTS